MPEIYLSPPPTDQIGLQRVWLHDGSVVFELDMVWVGEEKGKHQHD